MIAWVKRHWHTIVIVAMTAATYGFVAFLVWIALGMPFSN